MRMQQSASSSAMAAFFPWLRIASRASDSSECISAISSPSLRSSSHQPLDLATRWQSLIKSFKQRFFFCIRHPFLFRQACPSFQGIEYLAGDRFFGVGAAGRNFDFRMIGAAWLQEYAYRRGIDFRNINRDHAFGLILRVNIGAPVFQYLLYP